MSDENKQPIAWGTIPWALRAFFIVGVLGWVLCAIPMFLELPYILIPAGVFGASVLALLIYGVTRK